MKIKFIAAACLALCSSASFAAVTCTTSDIQGSNASGSGKTAKPAVAASPAAQNFVNTCVPDVVLYVAGSSALGGALSTVATNDLFDTSSQPIVKIIDNGSANGATGFKAVSAWYGMSKAAATGGTSKRLFVVYNKQNGSAAGVSQLLSPKDTTIPENSVVTIGPVKGTAGSCTVDKTSTSAAPVMDCTTFGLTSADMAISDVAPAELYALEGVKPAALSTLTNTPLAMQGFGIAVNANFYQALQTQNIAENLLPSSCTSGDLTAACQPTVRRADYASLVSVVGKIKTAAGFIPGDQTVLTLARRDDLSGTQAASNIFFADNACGVVPAKSVGLGGALAILSADNVSKAQNDAGLIVQANATGGGVVTALTATTGYAIGAISLTTAQPNATALSWKFVKIDGVSPTYNADGTAALKQRTAFASGNYPFAVASFAAYPTATKDAVKLALINTVIGGLQNSSLHNLEGIAYLDGVVPAQQSLVHRTAGNNCSPLIK